MHNHTDIFQLKGVCQGRFLTLETLLPDMHTSTFSITSRLLSSPVVCNPKRSGMSLIITSLAFVYFFVSLLVK